MPEGIDDRLIELEPIEQAFKAVFVTAWSGALRLHGSLPEPPHPRRYG
jgi:hypothetical protein